MPATATENQPTAATPSNGQTAPEAKAPVATSSATETKSAPGQEQKDSSSKPLGTLGVEAAQPAEAKPAAPQAYTLTPPKVGFDDEVSSVWGKVANELELPQEKAQKLLDKVAPALHERQLQQVNEERKGWHKAALEDTEIGGEKRTAVLEIANQALANFGTPALTQLLTEYGLTVHPEIIRLFNKVGTLISEDSIVNGKRVPSGPKTDAQILADMYPSMRKK